MRLAMMAGVALLATAMPTAAQGLDLGWMAGDWCTEAQNGEQTCEHWSAEIAGGVTGSSSTRKRGVTVSSERMVIDMSLGRLTFTALPDGATAPTPFPLVSRTATELVFENRAHDYPQRIRYWRDGAALMAEISLADGSKPQRWRYTAAQ